MGNAKAIDPSLYMTYPVHNSLEIMPIRLRIPPPVLYMRDPRSCPHTTFAIYHRARLVFQEELLGYGIVPPAPVPFNVAPVPFPYARLYRWPGSPRSRHLFTTRFFEERLTGSPLRPLILPMYVKIPLPDRGRTQSPARTCRRTPGLVMYDFPEAYHMPYTNGLYSRLLPSDLP